MPHDVIDDLVQKESVFAERLLAEVGKVVIGQRPMIERILIGLLTGGHVLLEGVPGLAKTLAVKTVADCFNLSFRRVQFTPDLLPADIVGTTIYRPQTQEFVAKTGPIFANLVLADEVNRAPAKVQSALLEAMQERQVTIGDETHPLPRPFMVMATQNPIEQEGTYALPEAQLDRFMLMIRVGYPAKAEERQIMDMFSSAETPTVEAVCGPTDLEQARSVVGQIHVAEKLRDYIVDLVTATRNPAAYGIKDMGDMIEWGASPRASIYLNLAARAHAFLRRRGHVLPEDIKAVGPDVLRHRVILTYEAEAENVTAEQIVRRLFERVQVP